MHLPSVAASAPVVLIANDQEWTARAVESILMAHGYQTHRAHTGAETMTMASRIDPDVVILDQQLPDFPGSEVCRRLRADPAFGATLPVLITTAGPSGRQQRMAAYEAGAWEFYGQPLDAEALLHKLTVFAKAYAEVRRFRQYALVDDESGLYTRTGLARRATELLGEARRSQREVSCVAWHLPRQLDAAEAAQLGRQLRQLGRAADAHGRLDATRFAVVAPGATAEGAARLAERFDGVFAGATATVVTAAPADFPLDGLALLERLPAAMAA